MRKSLRSPSTSLPIPPENPPKRMGLRELRPAALAIRPPSNVDDDDNVLIPPILGNFTTMALPQQAYKDRQFLAVIGDEVGFFALFAFAWRDNSAAVGMGGGCGRVWLRRDGVWE